MSIADDRMPFKMLLDVECPIVSREKVANILLAHAARSGNREVSEAAAEIARTAARSWLAPLLDTACDRLAFVLCNLFDIAIERNLHGHTGCDKLHGTQMPKDCYCRECIGYPCCMAVPLSV